MENKTEINIKIPEKVIEILTPAGNAVVDTFTDTWKFIWGPIQYYFKKANYRREKNFELFCNDLDNEFTKIPPENISSEPPISIIGPTIEASKWYFDENELRSMFAKLIAKSFDQTQISIIHPSFIEIIKQLDPIDAKMLSSIYLDKNTGIMMGSLIKKRHTYNLNLVNSIERSLETYNYYYLKGNYDMDLINISLDNLVRLNLINISYDIKLTNPSCYSKVKNKYHNIIRNLLLEQNPVAIENGFEVYIRYGKIVPTTLGNVFTSICLN